jgi:hypothetical protein
MRHDGASTQDDDAMPPDKTTTDAEQQQKREQYEQEAADWQRRSDERERQMEAHGLELQNQLHDQQVLRHRQQQERQQQQEETGKLEQQRQQLAKQRPGVRSAPLTRAGQRQKHRAGWLGPPRQKLRATSEDRRPRVSVLFLPQALLKYTSSTDINPISDWRSACRRS